MALPETERRLRVSLAHQPGDLPRCALPALACFAAVFFLAFVLSGSPIALVTSVGLTIWVVLTGGYKHWTDDSLGAEQALLISWAQDVTAELSNPRLRPPSEA
jgi:hypothetical protein